MRVAAVVTKDRALRAPVPLLFVHYGLNWITGSERCLLDLVTHVDRARFTPVVWCNAPVVAEAAEALGASAHLYPEWGDRGSLLPSPEHRRAARDLVRQHGIGLIHANDAEPLKALLPAAFGARIPILAHLHLRLTPDERRWSLVHQVTLAVGVSQTSLRGLRDDGFPESRTVVIYNGVDPERLGRGDARALRAEFGIGTSDVVFAVVGSLIPRKGIDVVLAAFSALRERRADCRLLVCGDGPEEQRLRALTEAEGISGVVHFLGRRGDVGAILRDAVDVLVSGAREESFGLNIAEAAVFGVPAIATDIEAHSEIVTHGVEGLLVPVNDSPAMADALTALAADPARRTALGAAALERTRRSFLVDRYVREFEAVYTQLLAAPPGAYGWPRAISWPRTYSDWAASIARRKASRLLGRDSGGR